MGNITYFHILTSATFVFYAPLIAFFVILMVPDKVKRDIAIVACLCYNFSTAWFISVCETRKFIYKDNQFSLYFCNWIGFGNSEIGFEFQFYDLTIKMAGVVCFISACVVCYAKEYMSNDPKAPTFLAFLCLFNFSINVLVFSSNLVTAFLGWESVGILSYLLIKHYDTRIPSGKAGTKAVVINKIGDIFLLIGIGGLITLYQTTDLNSLYVITEFSCFEQRYTGYTLELIEFDISCVCLILAAATKSAQFGLHPWLPDAMEGPTPVSALLHAATMVTVGVFLFFRLFPIIIHSNVAINLAIALGCASCFFAGATALCQNDLKKIIAFSTCGQLGYMMLACGMSSPEFAMFHLANHSFFKALLFLSAGAVIHALADEQDMRRMGGLINLLPFSYFCMFVGSLALMGTPFLTGFYSKEGILALCYSDTSVFSFWSYLLGLFSAVLSILYSLRLLFLTFLTKPNAFRQTIVNLHEAPLLMTIPMLLLLCGSVFFGFLAQDSFVGAGTSMMGYGITGNQEFGNYKTDFEFIPVYIKLIPIILLFIISVLYGYIYFYFSVNMSSFTSPVSRAIYYYLNQRWFFDFIYTKIIVLPALYVGEQVTTYVVDRGILELCGPYGLARSVRYFVSLIRKAHSGYISLYLVYILLGVLLFFSIKVHNINFCDTKIFLIGMCTYSFIRKFSNN